MSGRRDRLVGGIGGAEELPVAEGSVARSGQHGLGRGPAAAHGLGDAFALERIDQPGGVTDEEHPAPPGTRADHAHLQPATESAPQRRCR